MNVSIYLQTDYENIANWTLGENEPNSNPNKPNLETTPGQKESGNQVSVSKNRTINRNTCRKNVEIEMKFWYSGP